MMETKLSALTASHKITYGLHQSMFFFSQFEIQTKQKKKCPFLLLPQKVDW